MACLSRRDRLRQKVLPSQPSVPISIPSVTAAAWSADYNQDPAAYPCGDRFAMLKELLPEARAFRPDNSASRFLMQTNNMMVGERRVKEAERRGEGLALAVQRATRRAVPKLVPGDLHGLAPETVAPDKC